MAAARLSHVTAARAGATRGERGAGERVAPGGRRAGDAAGSPFCQGLGKRYQASLAAQVFCRGVQPHEPSGPGARAPAAGHRVPGAPGNVDAASPAEDVGPGGLRAYGQSEVSIGASGKYVIEAWNDATGVFAACPSPKAQFTGFGFSSNGGRSFTDLQGLPDARCSQYLYLGDPSVVAYRAGGRSYFYISSMFDAIGGAGRSFVALAACQVTGSAGRSALHCSQPIIAGASSQCQGRVCSFLDKDYLAIDPAHGRLFAAFTEFGFTDAGAVEASVCDLGTPAGRAGPAGGTPAAPVCKHGTGLHPVGANKLAGKPYLTIQQPDPGGCEYEGAYPAADTATGDLYVGYEYNWATSVVALQCRNSPRVRNIMAKVPRRCLALRMVSPCAAPAARASVPITSMFAANLPGYNRSPNDFPRLAVSDQAGTVTMVWNDAGLHPYGDVLLQSFTLASLRPVQARPVALDVPHRGGLTFMPAVRTATAAGLLDVTWYSRDAVTTSDTVVKAALGVSPRAARTPAANLTITTVPSNWDDQISDIAPNFGDYTDNALDATSTIPYVGGTLYVAWTDGRAGVPQPFEAHLPAGR